MRKNYVSNSEDSTRIFKNVILESLSKVHFFVPLIIFVPVIVYLSFYSLIAGIGVFYFICFFVFGLFVWTITEYLLHRYVFHFVPNSKIGMRIHFIFHGVHHDYPRDKMRLVMPPAASIILALLFYFLFSLILKGPLLFTFYAGFLIGYLIYDMTHYAIHHCNFKNRLFIKIKEHHMLHHYYDSTKGYGVSSDLWDYLLNSNFPTFTNSKQSVEKQNIAS